MSLNKMQINQLLFQDCSYSFMNGADVFYTRALNKEENEYYKECIKKEGDNCLDEFNDKIKRELQAAVAKEYDIVVMFSFFNRTKHFIRTFKSFQEAIKNTDLNVCIAVCELFHTYGEEDKSNGFENYLGLAQFEDIFYIKYYKNDMHAKCLGFNMLGNLFTNSKYFLLQDSDIMVTPDFFTKLEKNIEHYDGKVDYMQTYGLRRVLSTSPDLAKYIFNEAIAFSDLHENFPGVHPPGNYYTGNYSVGGSILLRKEVFYDIGGFDAPLFFTWGAEDLMFWDKMVTAYGPPKYCDYPVIDMYHLYHEPTHKKQFENKSLASHNVFTTQVWEYYKVQNDAYKKNYIKRSKELLENFCFNIGISCIIKWVPQDKDAHKKSLDHEQKIKKQRESR